MDPLFLLKELFSRAVARKWVIAVLISVYLCSTMCGIVFAKTPSFYEYHLRLCDRFLNEVCYSSTNVFLLFLERGAGTALPIALVSIGGVHPAALPLPVCTLIVRGYMMGGMLCILFSVYSFPGAVVALCLYLPVHLLIDGLLLLAASLSFSRAFRFSLCAGECRELLCDFVLIFCLALAVCAAEAVLLAAFFHPAGHTV